MKQTMLSLLSLSLLLGSCSEDECAPRHDQELTPVVFAPKIADVIDETRALKTDWSDGDKLAIFSDVGVKQNATTSTAAITYTRTSGIWTPPSTAEQWYFADASTQHNFYAYWPADTAVAASSASVEVPSIAGQDGTKTITTLKEENDFMRGLVTASKQSTAVQMQMWHAFVIVNLKVKLKDKAFTGNAATLTSVTITSSTSQKLVNASASDKPTLNLITGYMTSTSGLATLTLAPTAGFALTTTEVSIPVKTFSHSGKIKVQFTIGSKTSPAIELASPSNFASGYVYNYGVTLDAELQKIGIDDPIIFPWQDMDGAAITPVIPNA